MTKRQAAALIKAYRSKPESEMQRWWQNLILRAAKAQVDVDYLKRDRKVLLDVVEPTMLSTLREAGQAWIHLADSLEKLFQPNPRTKRRSTPDGPA
jgi:hypothetical protein